ncbi:nucleoside deaminase [bacterium]|nr:nucleoside deaminase [bacterium]
MFMQKAIEEAKKTVKDVPVGAVIVKNNKIISFAHNEKELTKNITGHAEIIAIQQAEKILGNWRLNNCEMYVTLEPCPMCAWAILQARIKTVYFGSFDKKYGAFISSMDLRKTLHSKTTVYGGIMEEECDKLLKDFFKKIR